MAAGDFEAAEAEAKAIAKIDADSPLAAWVRASVYSSKKQWKLASDVWSLAAKNSTWPFRSEMLAYQTVCLAECGELALARSLAAAAAPECVKRGFRARAAVHHVHHAYLAGRSIDARRIAREAVESDPSPEILVNVASIVARNGEQNLDWVLNYVPADLDLPRFRVARHRIQGYLAIAQGKFVQALQFFRSAAKEDPKPYGDQFVAYALALSGEREGARLELERLSEIRTFYSRNLCPR